MFKLEEGWLTVGLLGAMMVVAAAGVAAAGWTDGLNAAWITSLVAILAGLALARSHFSGSTAFLFATVYGLFVVGFFVGLSLPGDWHARSLELIVRLNAFLYKVLHGGTSRDPLPFPLTISLIFWYMGLLGAWSVFRRGGAWAAVIPAGVGLLVNAYYYLGPVRLDLYLAVYVLLGLMFVARMNLLSREREHASGFFPVVRDQLQHTDVIENTHATERVTGRRGDVEGFREQLARAGRILELNGHGEPIARIGNQHRILTLLRDLHALRGHPLRRMQVAKPPVRLRNEQKNRRPLSVGIHRAGLAFELEQRVQCVPRGVAALHAHAHACPLQPQRLHGVALRLEPGERLFAQHFRFLVLTGDLRLRGHPYANVGASVLGWRIAFGGGEQLGGGDVLVHSERLVRRQQCVSMGLDSIPREFVVPCDLGG